MPRPEEELYNVKKYPFQFNNIAEAEGTMEILRYLRKALDIWIEQTGDSKPSNPTPDRDDEYGKPLGNFNEKKIQGHQTMLKR